MPLRSWFQDRSKKYPSGPYAAPFVAFICFLALSGWYPLGAVADGLVRVVLLGLICFVCWPQGIQLRVQHPFLSAIAGLSVFVLWIAPDLLLPGYRNTWLFSNSLVGHVHSTLSPADLANLSVLFLRSIRATVIVPIVEELFWRGWLMRWLIDSDFRKVPLGTYSHLSFWLVACLFASEHGPYWDVGLLTGIIYNAWMIRSKSISDCVLMHAVTNGALSVYVVVSGRWEYWQ